MAHQMRRGTDAERQTVTFLDGEPVWCTDTKRLWVGDGATLGAIQVSAVLYVPDVATGEVQQGNVNTVLYVYSLETFYRYVVSGAAYTRDGIYVLNTLAGGNTRWVGVAGQYVIQDKGIIGTDTEATLGANIVTNGDFATGDFTGWTAGANWSAATNAAVHTAGSTATLETNGAVVAANSWYKVTFTISGRTAGGLQFSLGGTDFESPAGSMDVNVTNFSVGIYTTNTNQFIITPTNDFDGQIDDVVIELADIATPVLRLSNDDTTAHIEMRTGGTGNASLFAGLNSGVMNDASGNVGIGDNALTGAHATTNNIAIGSNAVKRVAGSGSSSNIGIGTDALEALGAGVANIAIGTTALNGLFVGNYNIAIGAESLENNLDGSQNVAIGYRAGENNVGDRNIFLGYNAGGNETGDDKLYIHNTSTTTPLIYGDFSTYQIKINGELETYTEVARIYNDTGGNLNQYTVIRAVDYDAISGGLEVNAISDYSHIPIGIMQTTLATATRGQALTRGLMQVTGFDTSLAALGDTVYCDNSGALTLTRTALAVGTVVVLNANGRVYFDFSNKERPLKIFADVATAEAASGKDDDLCYVAANRAFYEYVAIGIGLSDDNEKVLSTGDGGNTRWVCVGGQYDLNRPLEYVDTVANAALVTNVSLHDLLYVAETDTIYRYETVGAAYTVDGLHVLATLAGGNTRWLGIAGRYLADPNYVSIITEEPTGFPIDSTTGEVNTGAATLSFTDGTRTFDITPTGADFDYYIGGKRYVSTGDSIVIANTEGIHYIYYDDTGTIQESTTFDVEYIYSQALIAIVYWDTSTATHIYLGDERHGVKMDGHTHAIWHLTQGTAFISGCALNTIATEQNGSADAHAQFGVDVGVIRDEDLGHSLSSVLSTTGLPVYYKTGATGEWNRTTNAGFSFTVGATPLPNWNEWTGAVWQVTEVTNNDYVLVHVFATNDTTNSYIAIMGQNEYGSLSAAQTGANAEIANLVTAGLPFAEFVPVATVILQCRTTYTNSVNARTRAIDTGADYVDWRYAKISPNAVSVSSHSNLSDLSNDDHREIYASKEGRTGDIGVVSTTGNIDDLVNATYTGYVFDGAGSVVLRGLVAASDSKKFVIINDTGNSMSINNEDTNSAAANRIVTGTAADLTLPDTGSIQLAYEETSQRWRITGGTGGTASPPTGDALRIRLAAEEIDGTINTVDTDISLYQVAALSSVLKASVTIINRNASSVSVRLAHVDGAIGSVANEDYICYDTTFLAFEKKTFEIPGMAASDSILIRSDTADVNFQLHGYFTATVEALKRIAAYDIVAADTNEQVVALVSNTANLKYYICNKSGSASCSVRMALIDGALGVLADEDYSLYEEVIAAGETKSYDLNEGLALGGTIMFRSSRTDTNIIVYGEEY